MNRTQYSIVVWLLSITVSPAIVLLIFGLFFHESPDFILVYFLMFAAGALLSVPTVLLMRLTLSIIPEPRRARAIGRIVAGVGMIVTIIIFLKTMQADVSVQTLAILLPYLFCIWLFSLVFTFRDGLTTEQG